MTTQDKTQIEQSSAVQAAAAAASAEHSVWSRPAPKWLGPMLFKGALCVGLGLPLAAGVIYFGGGERSSWGSALIGILFVVMVMGSSGSNGVHPEE